MSAASFLLKVQSLAACAPLNSTSVRISFFPAFYTSFTFILYVTHL